MVLAHVEINSWRGISIGAIHWYGKLRVEENGKEVANIELQRPITTAEAKQLNIQAKEAGYLIRRNKAGDLSDGFMTREEAVLAAIKHFKANYTGFLFDGSSASCSAWKNIIVWPKGKNYLTIVIAMNGIAQKFQSLNGYECEPEKMKIVENLDESWYKLYTKVENLCKTSPTQS